MEYEVMVQVVPSRYAAVVRDRRKWADLGAKLMPLLDRVYVEVRAGRVAQAGHNIFIYRDATKDEVTVEIGVEVSAPFEPTGGVVFTATPAGEVASTRHPGPYSGLGGAYEAVIRWCQEHGRRRGNVYWEVYGDPDEDTGEVETEVVWSLLPERG
jgi:effector-binding domain-containing protein